MRIALLAPFGLQPKATTSARMVPLAQALARRGHMVRVVIPPWDDPSVVNAAVQQESSVAAVVSVSTGDGNEAAVAGVHTVALALPRRAPNSLALTYGLLKQALNPSAQAAAPFEGGAQQAALRALTSFRAEVVHVFKPVGYSGLAGFALKALRVPWALDVDDWEGAGGFAGVNRYSAVERLSVMLMEAMLPRLAEAVTAASHTLEARAWNMGISRRRVGYMPNGVWRDRYASWYDPSRQTGPLQWSRSELHALIRKEYGLEDGPIILLYTRFAEFPYKWPLVVLKRVLADYPTAKLLVVGNGFFGEEEKLKIEARRIGLGRHVAITGRVAEAALPAYLSLADVAIYPMADTLLNRAKSPVKALEPMLMSLPIVAHRVGQAAEFIGDTGILVRPGDLGGMAQGVLALLGDTGRRTLLGARAQQRVWRRFNWQELSAVAERIYRVALPTSTHD